MSTNQVRVQQQPANVVQVEEHHIRVTPEKTQIQVVSAATQGVPGKPGKDAEVMISSDPYNRAAKGTDGGVFVSDELNPDPLAHYLLTRG